jgi:hypothetical protein
MNGILADMRINVYIFYSPGFNLRRLSEVVRKTWIFQSGNGVALIYVEHISV